jgi:hypothetical protein
VGESEKDQIPTKEFLKFSPAGSTPFLRLTATLPRPLKLLGSERFSARRRRRPGRRRVMPGGEEAGATLQAGALDLGDCPANPAIAAFMQPVAALSLAHARIGG